MINQILPRLPEYLRAKVPAIASETVDTAVADGLGCRWIQEILLRAMINSEKEVNSPGEPVLTL